MTVAANNYYLLGAKNCVEYFTSIISFKFSQDSLSSAIFSF